MTIDTDGNDCPVPNAHDRFEEAHYFLHCLERVYHHPLLFRFNLHAYLSAISSIRLLASMDLQRIGLIRQWNEHQRSLPVDEVLSSLYENRNDALHLKSLNSQSVAEAGIFRNRNLKLAVEMRFTSDQSSESILEIAKSFLIGKLLDAEHSAIGEQIGVHRLYYLKDLGIDNQDLLITCRRGLTSAYGLLQKAHSLTGAELEFPNNPEAIHPEDEVTLVTVLLESDLDPELPVTWDWH
jgi:hypothetical protein